MVILKAIIVGLTLLGVMIAPLCAAITDPVIIRIQDIFLDPNSSSALNGTYDVTVNVRSSDTGWIGWDTRKSSIEFSQGQFSMDLGESPDPTLRVADFDHPALKIRLEANGQVSTFNLSSVPFAISARYAEMVSTRSGTVDSSVIYGVFGTMNVSSTARFSTTRNAIVIPRGSTRVGIGKSPLAGALDIGGTLNATSFFIQGVPFRDAISWKHSSVVSDNIYYDGGRFIGIGTARPRFALDVIGTVNVLEIREKGTLLASLLDWTVIPAAPGSSPNIYYDQPNSQVGIGTVSPKAKLDVKFAISVGNTSRINTGNIRFRGDDNFEGYVGKGVNDWERLTGIEGGGQLNNLTYWEGQGTSTNRVDFTSRLSFPSSSKQFLGIAENNPSASIHIKDDIATSTLFRARTSTNNLIMQVNDQGKVAIATTNFTHALNIGGDFNARDLLVNGLPLRLSISTGTFWLINDEGNIYYLLDRVGIGKPPGIGSSPLQISQIQGRGRQQNPLNNQDPAITFSTPLSDAAYTFGVDAAETGTLGVGNQVFRVESGLRLGEESPLFVVQRDRLGVGVKYPRANLHVSGNLGLILEGKTNLTSTRNVAVEGPGTRFIWHPEFAALRVGRLLANSPFLGHEWDYDNLGLYSIGFGLNSFPSGNFSVVMGGDQNFAGGAFSTISGGQQNETNDFATMALGQRSKANHFGAFIWNDANRVDFSTSTLNQFLVRPNEGLGINTANTIITLSGVDQSSAFTLMSRVVLPMDFLTIALTPANSQAIFTKLVQTRVITSLGTVTANFNVNTPLTLTGLTLSGGVQPLLIEPEIRRFVGRVSTLNAIRFVDVEAVPGRATSIPTLISNRGGLVVGTSNYSKGLITIFGKGMSIATTNATIGLYVVSPPTLKPGATSNYRAALVMRGSQSSSPSIIINASGNIGMGQVEPFKPPFGFLGEVPILRAPTIAADEFVFPDGERLSTSPPYAVWITTNMLPYDPLNPTANRFFGPLYFISGNVGIGASTPNNLLELSSFGSQGLRKPIITFDVNGIDRFRMGLLTTDRPTFSIGVANPTNAIPTAAIFITSRSVGIGKAAPRGVFNVLGNTYLEKGAVVNTANRVYPTSGFSIPSLNTVVLLINDEIVSPWTTVSGSTAIFHSTAFNPTAIPPQYSFVGIGVRTPSVELEVRGTFNIQSSGSQPSMIISKQFLLPAGLKANRLKFRDEGFDEIANLIVSGGDLILQTSEGARVISKTFSSGISSPGGSGPIMVWGSVPGQAERFTIMNDSLITWRTKRGNVPGRASLTGNVSVVGRSKIQQFSATSSVSLNPDLLNQSILIDTNLDHNGSLTQPRSFVGKQIIEDLAMPYSNATWVTNHPLVGGVREKFTAIGLDVNVKNLNNTFFTRRGRMIGLLSDVSLVGVQSVGDRGFKYPFIVVSGNVGVGTSTPRATLEVIGTIDADFFQISQRLTVTTLNMRNGDFYVGIPQRVGLDTTSPQTELDINGAVRTTHLKTRGLRASSLIVNTANFSAQNGRVGIGTTAPSAQLDLTKSFTNLSEDLFTFQSIHATANASGSSTGAMTGMIVTMSSTAGGGLLPSANMFGGLDGSGNTAIGTRIDLSGLALDSTAKIIGVEVIATLNASASRNAALFLGGPVGMGTLTPSRGALLTVSGSIWAKNIPSVNFLTEQEVGSFNFLHVLDPTVTTTIQNKLFARRMIVNTIAQDRMDVGSLVSLNINLTVQNEFTNETTSLNKGIRARSMAVSQRVSANTGQFTKLKVGEGLSGLDQFIVQRGIVTDRVVATTNLSAFRATLNEGQLAVIEDQVSLGRSGTRHKLSTVLSSTAAFNAGNTATWRGVLVQSNTDTANYASGFILVPDSSNRGGVGSGLAAIRLGTGPTIGHHLAFISDPQTGLHQERMRLLANGRLGIGTTQPSASLHVIGSISATTVRPQRTIFVRGISGLSGGISLSTTNIVPTVNHTGVFAMNGALSFTRTQPIIGSVARKAIYVASGNNYPIFSGVIGSALVTGNLGELPSATGLQIPFFATTHRMSVNSGFKWSTENIVGQTYYGVLSIRRSGNFGTGNVGALYEGHISSSNTQTSFTQASYRFGFPSRSAQTRSTFTGVDIFASGNQLMPNDNDKVVGLRVSMDDTVRDLSFLPEGQQQQGSKIAAVFMVGTQTSGNIGIYASRNATTVAPKADIHVISDGQGTPALRVGYRRTSTITGNALDVSETGFVRIGSANPTAQLDLFGRSATANIFNVLSLDGSGLFMIDRLGRASIGTTRPPSANLHVQGTVSASVAALSIISSNAMDISSRNNGLVVTSLGFVGMGMTAPIAQLHVARTFTLPSQLQTSYALRRSTIDITASSTITRNLTGAAVQFKSAAGGVFSIDSGTVTHEAALVKIRTPIEALSTGRVIGLNVNVATSRNSFAAIFSTGNIGIGVTAPLSKLHVAGSIRANNFSGVSPNLEIVSANLTALKVLRVSSFSSVLVQVTSQNTAGRISARTLNVTQQATVGGINPLLAATFQSVGAGRLMTSRQISVGTSNRKTGVSLFVPRTANVSREVRVLESVKTNALASIGALLTFGTTVNVTATLNLQSPTSGFLTARSLYLQPQTILTSPGHGTLMTLNDVGNSLAFHVAGGITVNFSTELIRTPGRFPYFAGTGDTFTTDPRMRFSISTPNAKDFRISSIQLGSPTATVSTSYPNGSPGALLAFPSFITRTQTFADDESVNLFRNFVEFRNRSEVTHAGTAPTFTGTNIFIAGDIQNNETAIGLQVSLNIQASTTDLPIGEDSELSATRIAARFKVGNDTDGAVGIFITTQNNRTVTPRAELHVSSDVRQLPLLIVDTKALATAHLRRSVFLSATGLLGINTATPTSTVSIRSTASRSILIAASNDTPILGSYGALDRIGIGTTVPEARMHLVGQNGLSKTLLIHTRTPSGNNAIGLTNTGLFGFGTAEPSTNVHVVYNRNLVSRNMVVITDGTGVPGLQAAWIKLPDVGNGMFGLSETAITDYFSTCVGADVYVGVVTQNNIGRIFDFRCVGAAAIPANVTVAKYEDIRPFSISRNVLVVEANGDVGIGIRPYQHAMVPFRTPFAPEGTATTFYRGPAKLLVDGPIGAGDVVKANFGSWFGATASAALFRGFVAGDSTGPEITAFGMFREDTTQIFNTVLNFGTASDDVFVIDHNGTNRMTIDGTYHVAFGAVVTRDATLKILGNGTTPVFLASRFTTTPDFVITTNGRIGVGTRSPRAHLHINGLLTGTSIIPPRVGTTLTVITTNIRSNVGSRPALQLTPTISAERGSDFLQQIQTIRFAINKDIPARNMVSLQVKMSADSIASPGSIYGLKVNMSGVSVFDPDPSSSQISGGGRVAAVFEGGSMMIGSDSPIDHRGFLAVFPVSAGVTKPTGNIAQFVNTSANRVFQLRSAVVESTKFAALGLTTNRTNIVSIKSLEGFLSNTGLPITQRAVFGIWKELIDTGIVDPTTNRITAVAYDADTFNDSAYNLLFKNDVVDVLNSHKRMVAFKIHAQEKYQDDSLIPAEIVTNNMYIYLLSGLRGHRFRDSSEVLEGRLGIGFNLEGTLAQQREINKIDSALTVSGDVRMGVSGNAEVPGSAGYGSILYFSGATRVSNFSTDLGTALDSENNDELWMGRFNVGLDKSELRMGVGETNRVNANAKFLVTSIDKYFVSGSTRNVFAAGVFSFVDPLTGIGVPNGRVGIATANPTTTLHVVGTTNGARTGATYRLTSSNFLVTVENRNSRNAEIGGLVIQHSGASLFGRNSKFMTFMRKKNSAVDIMGGIQGDTSGGIEFASPDADYAEYLLKQNPQDKLQPGDIIGVKGGKISRNLAGADQLMVMSTSPIIAGNWPRSDNDPRYGLVAFLGQVDIRVRGPVNLGDYIIPSGENDGTGIAVSPEAIRPTDVTRIVGRAWAKSTRETVKPVKTLIGFPFSVWAMTQHHETIAALQDAVAAVREENQAFKDHYGKKLEERDILIAQLKQAMKERNKP